MSKEGPISMNSYQLERLMRLLPTEVLVAMRELEEIQEEVDHFLLNSPTVPPILWRQLDERDHWQNAVGFRTLELSEYIVPLPPVIPWFLRGVSMFNPVGKNVRRLELSWLKVTNEQLALLGSLGTVRSLGLVKCIGYDSLEGLRGIARVILEGSPAGDLAPLADCQEVHLSACPTVVDLAPLRRVGAVTVENCSSVQDLSPLEEVEELSLAGYTPYLFAEMNKYDFSKVKEMRLNHYGVTVPRVQVTGKGLPIVSAHKIHFIGRRDDLPPACELEECSFSIDEE